MSLRAKLRGLPRRFFSAEEASQLLHINPASVNVLLSRKVKAGELQRVRRGLYVFTDEFKEFEIETLFELANFLQTPSYISYLTALSYFGCTTQIHYGMIESTNKVRSRFFQVSDVTFSYHFCREKFFAGYERKGNFFIATPEKALLDSVYLLSLDRYAMDHSALDLKNIRWLVVEKFLRRFPRRFKGYFRRWRDRFERSATS